MSIASVILVGRRLCPQPLSTSRFRFYLRLQSGLNQLIKSRFLINVGSIVIQRGDQGTPYCMHGILYSLEGTMIEGPIDPLS